MLIHQTMEKLAQMKLTGLLEGLREQTDNQDFNDLSFEERFGCLVDKEFVLRENRRLIRRLREARLKVQTDLAISKAEGTYHKLTFTLAKRDLLVIDDWLRDPLTAEQARYIVDLFDDRFRNSSTLLSSQFPVSSWHERFKDPTLADAIMDRIVHDSYRLKLKGDSMRKTTSPLT